MPNPFQLIVIILYTVELVPQLVPVNDDPGSFDRPDPFVGMKVKSKVLSEDTGPSQTIGSILEIFGNRHNSFKIQWDGPERLVNERFDRVNLW